MTNVIPSANGLKVDAYLLGLQMLATIFENEYPMIQIEIKNFFWERP